jgi:pilus assembly protein CpaC
MTKTNIMKRAMLATTVAAMLSMSFAATFPSAAIAQTAPAARPVDQRHPLGRRRSDGPPRKPDERPLRRQRRDRRRSGPLRHQLYLFGKAPGETTVYATNKAGKVVYRRNVRVGNNIGSVNQLLTLAMPDARIQATPMNGVVLLTGTVALPPTSRKPNRIVQAFVGEGTQVISRLKTATPLQVMLKVKIAEVSRTLTGHRRQSRRDIDGGRRHRRVISRADQLGTLQSRGGGFSLHIPTGGSAPRPGLPNVLGLDIARARRQRE